MRQKTVFYSMQFGSGDLTYRYMRCAHILVRVWLCTDTSTSIHSLITLTITSASHSTQLLQPSQCLPATWLG